MPGASVMQPPDCTNKLPRMRIPRMVLACGLASASVAGCGGGDSNTTSDQAAVRATVVELTAASRAGSGTKICDELFTPLLKQSVAKAARRPCATEVSAKLLSPKAKFDVQDVAVQGSQATATVMDQFGKASTLSLVKAKGGWRISGVTSAQGK